MSRRKSRKNQVQGEKAWKWARSRTRAPDLQFKRLTTLVQVIYDTLVYGILLVMEGDESRRAG